MIFSALIWIGTASCSSNEQKDFEFYSKSLRNAGIPLPFVYHPVLHSSDVSSKSGMARTSRESQIFSRLSSYGELLFTIVLFQATGTP